MIDETTKGFSTSIYVTDRQAFEECKRLLKLQGGSLSRDIMDFVLRRLDELRGVKHDTSVEEAGRKYEALKKRCYGLVKDVNRMKRSIEKEFEGGAELCVEALGLFESLGLRPDFGNAGEVIPKFLVAWKGDQEFMHEFISLVEVAREKKRVIAQLREIRSAKPVDPGPA